LIFDQVVEGFGGTGKMFASEHYLTPDILVLDKSLGGGGVPLAGIVPLERDRTTKERAAREAEAIMFKCMERGLAFKTIEGNVMTLRPALVLTREEMD
jgi:4-aminobutyrate aminotransferase-like enzyme